MARPLESDKRLEIARRAVVVLQREGLEISMSRLAEALELKRPTLLYHFPTKSELVEAALEDLLREQATFVIEKILAEEHPIDRLYAQLRAVHAFHHQREERIVFLTQAIAATAGERMRAIIEVGNRVFAPYRQAAVELLRQGIAQGTVAPCDPEALVAVIRALIDGLLVQRVMTGLSLEPVHQLVWDRLLSPLKLPFESPVKLPPKLPKDPPS
jgi:AcrR family transcriptional regulator